MEERRGGERREPKRIPGNERVVVGNLDRDAQVTRRATRNALAAIALWSALATLAVRLRQVPPFLLVGLALLLGSVLGLHRVSWRDVRLKTLAVGVCGLFAYHFCLERWVHRAAATKHAPPPHRDAVRNSHVDGPLVAASGHSDACASRGPAALADENGSTIPSRTRSPLRRAWLAKLPST